MLFLCLHWCYSSSHCYHLQISLTYCLYSLFQVINNKDIKSGSTYLLLISPQEPAPSCLTLLLVILLFTWLFSASQLECFHICIYEKESNILLRQLCIMLTLLHHLYPKPVILIKCGRIRFDWLKAQIILVWLLCLFLFCAYCLFSITWSFNLVVQKSRLTSLLVCYNPEIHGLHHRSIWSPTLLLAATNRWYLRQKLGEKY